MAESLSLEDAEKLLSPRALSLEDAEKLLAPRALSFEDAEQLLRPSPAPLFPDEMIDQPTEPTAVGRVIGKGIEAGTEALELDRPIGTTESALQPLRDIGLIPGQGPASPQQTFNEIVIRAGAEGFDILGRGINTILSTATAVVGQAGRELGIISDETEQQRFERDLRGLMDSTLLVMGSAPPVSVARSRGRVSPRIRDRITREVEQRIERDFPGADIIAKEAMKERAVETVVSGIETAALEGARTKIGQPSLGQVKEAARFSFVDEAITNTLDALRPIKLVAEREAKARGVTPDLAPYRDMRLAAGVDGVIESVFRHGTLAREGGDVVFRGRSFNEVFTPVADDLDDFGLYAVGRRAQELTERGIETPFSPEEMSAMVRLGERNPALAQTFDDWQQFNREMLDFAEQSGVLSKETKAKFLEAGQSYVPFYRLITEGERAGKPLVSGSPFRRIKGGDAPLNEIMDNITRNTVMWVDLSVKNHAKAQVYRMIDDFGLDDIAARVPNVPKSGILVDEGIESALVNMGMKEPGEAVSVFTAPRIIGENIDSVYINGKRVLYEIKDPVFLKALTAFSPRNYGLSMRIVSGFSNVLRRGVTLSPDFMVRNLARDTQAAFLQSGGAYVPGVDAIRGIVERIRKDDNYWEMLANGGGFATLYRGETANIQNLQKIYSSHGIRPSRVLDTPRKLADGLEEISSAFEQASRISEFRIMRGRGASRRDAALSSREVSTDFALRGASGEIRAIAASVPFLNARAQGLARLVREAKNNPAKLALKATAAMTVPSIALYMINKDDPRYKQMPDWVKDLHWVIFTPGSDDAYLIPKGFEYGALFATVPERMMEAIETRHGKAFASALERMFFDTFSVGPPQIIAPPLGGGLPFTEFSGFNRRFTGAPVVPADLQDVRLSEQFRPWTSETLVQLAQAMRQETGIEISPQKAENLVIGYLGTLGLYALGTSDMLVRSLTGQIAPELRVDEIPLGRSFIRKDPIRGTQFETDFYDLLGESRMVAATMSKMIKEGRNPDMTEREKLALAIRKPVEQVAELSSRISKAMRLIRSDNTLSAKEKRRRLDDLQEKRNQLFLEFARGVPREMLLERGLTVP